MVSEKKVCPSCGIVVSRKRFVRHIQAGRCDKQHDLGKKKLRRATYGI